MLLSVFVALTVTPAMCASLLRRPDVGPAGGGPRRGLFAMFNRGFDRMTRGYRGVIAWMLRGPVKWLVPYAAICVVLYVFLGKSADRLLAARRIRAWAW